MFITMMSGPSENLVLAKDTFKHKKLTSTERHFLKGIAINHGAKLFQRFHRKRFKQCCLEHQKVYSCSIMRPDSLCKRHIQAKFAVFCIR